MVQLEGFLGNLNNIAGNIQAVGDETYYNGLQPLFSSINSPI